MAVTKLLKGHEVLLAVALGWAVATPGVGRLTETLARQCEAAGDWTLSMQVGVLYCGR